MLALESTANGEVRVDRAWSTIEISALNKSDGIHGLQTPRLKSGHRALANSASTSMRRHQQSPVAYDARHRLQHNRVPLLSPPPTTAEDTLADRPFTYRLGAGSNQGTESA